MFLYMKINCFITTTIYSVIHSLPEAFPDFYYAYNQLIREVWLIAVKLSVNNIGIYLHLPACPITTGRGRGQSVKAMSLNSASLDSSRNFICAGNKGDVSKIINND